MKKFLFLTLAIFALGVTCSFGQSTNPRWGAGPPSEDNTGRILTFGVQAVSTTTAAVLFPRFYTTLASIATSSVSPTLTANVTKSFYGDQISLFIAANAVGTRTITLGTNIIGSATTQTLAASKKGHFEFIFDGVKYFQTSYTAEP